MIPKSYNHKCCTIRKPRQYRLFQVYISRLKYLQLLRCEAKREPVLSKVLRERSRERARDPISELSIFRFYAVKIVTTVPLIGTKFWFVITNLNRHSYDHIITISLSTRNSTKSKLIFNSRDPKREIRIQTVQSINRGYLR